MGLVTYTVDTDGVGVLILNNPDNLNAMDEEMAVQFKALVTKLASDKPRVVILSGAGRAFSAGGNLQMLKAKAQLEKDENKRRMLEFYDSFLCIRTLGVPIIAALNGHAIGAGLCLACACDIRVAAAGARLGLTFTRLGLHPGMGATYFVPRVLGYARAQEFLLTARVITAEEAETFGLVTSVAPAPSVVETARKIAREILSCGPVSVSQLLSSLRADDRGLQEALEREASLQAENYAGAEFMEGVSALIEKRSPSFALQDT